MVDKMKSQEMNIKSMDYTSKRVEGIVKQKPRQSDLPYACHNCPSFGDTHKQSLVILEPSWSL